MFNQNTHHFKGRQFFSTADAVTERRRSYYNYNIITAYSTHIDSLTYHIASVFYDGFWYPFRPTQPGIGDRARLWCCLCPSAACANKLFDGRDFS